MSLANESWGFEIRPAQLPGYAATLVINGSFRRYDGSPTGQMGILIDLTKTDLATIRATAGKAIKQLKEGGVR